MTTTVIGGGTVQNTLIHTVPWEQTTFIVGSATNAGILGLNQPFQIMSELVAQSELVPPQPLTNLQLRVVQTGPSVIILSSHMIPSG
jgi:hypothetical protein